MDEKIQRENKSSTPEQEKSQFAGRSTDDKTQFQKSPFAGRSLTEKKNNQPRTTRPPGFGFDLDNVNLYSRPAKSADGEIQQQQESDTEKIQPKQQQEEKENNNLSGEQQDAATKTKPEDEKGNKNLDSENATLKDKDNKNEKPETVTNLDKNAKVTDKEKPEINKNKSENEKTNKNVEAENATLKDKDNKNQKPEITELDKTDKNPEKKQNDKTVKPETNSEKTATPKPETNPEKTPENQDNIEQKAVAKIDAQQQKVAGEQAQAETAVKESTVEQGASDQQLANTQVNFAQSSNKPTFATTEEGINILAPEEILGSAGNNLVLYQTDNPEESLAAKDSDIPVYPIAQDKAANFKQQQQEQAQAAISQFMASGEGRKAQIASLGTTIQPRIQTAANQARAAVDASIAQNQNAIANSIAQARTKAQNQAQSARSQITAQHSTTVASIRESTTAARQKLQKEYQASLAQLTQTETSMAGRIAAPFDKGAQDFRAAGVKVGQEAIQIGADFGSQYAKQSPPEPSNVITEFLESFDRETYVQNWRDAKIKAARDLANQYNNGLIQDANQKASQLAGNQPEVLKGMQDLVAATRTSLETKYTAALEQLNTSEQQALQTANTTLNSQIQGIDQNLNSTEASLEQMLSTQSQQLQAAGEQQKLGIDANAKQVTAALQQGVNSATNNLQAAFQQFSEQAQGIKTPNLQNVASVIAEAEEQLNGMMTATQTELETGISNSAEGIVQQGQQTAASFSTLSQQAASSSGAVADEFATSMSQAVSSANQVFSQLLSGHTSAVNASVEKSTAEFKQMTADVGQKLDGVVQNLTQKLSESTGQLENGLRGSLGNLRSEIPKKAQEAADKVQPAWKKVVKVIIDIVITVAVTVAIAALAASGVGLVAAIGLAALIGAAGALAKQAANDLVDGKMSDWQTYAKQAGIGAATGVLQLVGLRGAEKVAGLVTNKVGNYAAKVGIESLGDSAVDITQKVASGEEFSLTMIGKSFGSSLLGNAGGQALKSGFGKLGNKLGADKIESKVLKAGGNFAAETVSDTATDVTSQVAFERKDLSWGMVGESAGKSALSNLAAKGANKAYGDRLSNWKKPEANDVHINDQQNRPIGETTEPTKLVDTQNLTLGETPEPTKLVDPKGHPLGETPEPTKLVDPKGHPLGETPEPTKLVDPKGRPLGETPEPTQIIDPKTNKPIGEAAPPTQLLDQNGKPLFNPSDAEIDAWAANIKEGGDITAGPLISAPAPTDLRLGKGQKDYWSAEPKTGMTIQEYQFPAKRGLPERDAAGNIIPNSQPDIPTKMRIHSPDPTAPDGSVSGKEWTVGIEQEKPEFSGKQKQKQGVMRTLPDGESFDTRYHTNPDGTRLDLSSYEQGTDGTWVDKSKNRQPVTNPDTIKALEQWNRNMADSHIPLFPEHPTPASPESKTPETGGTPPTTTTTKDTPTSSGSKNKADQENLPKTAKEGEESSNNLDINKTENTSKVTSLNPEAEQILAQALPRDLQGRVPINIDPDLPGNTVRVHYEVDSNGLVTNVHMRAGAGATSVDIQLHAQTVRLMQNYSGFSGRIRILKERLQGWITKNGEPPVGSRAWEAKLEVEKLPRIIDERLNQLSQGSLDADAQASLRGDIENLQQQLATHQRTLDEMDANPGSGFVAAEGTHHIANLKDESLLSSIREGFSSGNIKLGEELGRGGFGTVYEIPGHPNLVIKVATESQGRVNEQLVKESTNLSNLTEKGYPTVYKGLIEWVDPNGITRQGIVMEKVEGALSKRILRTGKFENEPIDPSLEALVTQKTIEDLNAFRQKAKDDDLVIEDIQFMVSEKDGSIHLIDPARIYDLPSRGQKRKKEKNAYLTRIDKMINKFNSILDKKQNEN